MYDVLIKDGDKEMIIHSLVSSDAPKILEGTIKLGINTIDNFTFNIFSNNPGFSHLKNLKTLIQVYDRVNRDIIFRGRVLLVKDKMDKNISKNITCESELGFLMDSTTRYGEYHDISVEQFLSLLLDNHNRQVSSDKEFKLGKVEVTGNLYRFTKYEKTFTSIKDNLLDRLGGELRVRYENNTRYLDYLINFGEKKSTQICLNKNLKTLEQEKDPTKIITRLVPLGAKINDSEERLTVAELNDGKDYIDDLEAIKTFGIIEDCNTWDDVTLVENLLSKGKNFLIENNKVLKKYKIQALDLALIGLDFNSFELGNTYRVINTLMNVNEDLRVIEKTIDLSNPQTSELSVGQKFEDIKSYQLGITKNAKITEKIKSNLETTVKVVNNISNDLNKSVETLNETIEVLNQTNQNVDSITGSLIEVSSVLQTNIAKTNELVETTNLIKDNLIDTNKTLEKLNKRIILGV